MYCPAIDGLYGLIIINSNGIGCWLFSLSLSLSRSGSIDDGGCAVWSCAGTNSQV